MINLPKSFHSILKKYGHDVILQRKLGESNSGPIYSQALERVTTRYSYPKTEGLTTMREEKPEGFVNTFDIVYYFEAAIEPQEGDLIIEMDERFENKRTIWDIDQALAMRGRGGIVNYWVAGVTRKSSN